MATRGHVTLTQALAHGHAVLLRIEIVAVAGAASVNEAHALPLANVEVPARHGGAAGAGLGLQGAHRCRGDRALDQRATRGQHFIQVSVRKNNRNWDGNVMKKKVRSSTEPCFPQTVARKTGTPSQTFHFLQNLVFIQVL